MPMLARREWTKGRLLVQVVLERSVSDRGGVHSSATGLSGLRKSEIAGVSAKLLRAKTYSVNSDGLICRVESDSDPTDE